jgi:hypothetical protein
MLRSPQVRTAHNKESDMRKMTVKSKAWISPYANLSPADLREESGVQQLTISTANMQSAGYTFVGEAEITVEIPDEKTLVDNKVAALRNERASVLAEARMKATKIDGQINDLLAIGYDAPVPA